MPPRWMWPFDERLEEWFAEVRRARNRKYGTHSDDDEDEDYEPRDDDEMGGGMTNEFAAKFMKGIK